MPSYKRLYPGGGYILGIWPLALLGVGLGWGVANKELRRFENIAAMDLLSALDGPEKQLTVRTKPEGPFGPAFADFARGTIIASKFSTEGLPLFTDPDLAKTGTLRKLELRLSDFTLRGLQVETLEATIPNCKFDRNLALRHQQIRLSRSGVGTGFVRVRQESLEPFILKKVREIKRVKVKLDRGKAWVEGYGEFLVAKTEFLVVADLSIEDGTKLNLTNARVILGWQKADDLAKKVLLDALNPVVDLRKDLELYDAVYLRDIELKDGYLKASGDTKIPDRPVRKP